MNLCSLLINLIYTFTYFTSIVLEILAFFKHDRMFVSLRLENFLSTGGGGGGGGDYM